MGKPCKETHYKNVMITYTGYCHELTESKNNKKIVLYLNE